MPREVFTTDAFVLRTVDYGDAHVIVTLLTRDRGRLGAIARAAKRSHRRFGGSLLPLRSVRASVAFRPGRDLGELQDAVVTRDFPGIEGSYDRITVASYATELVRNYMRDGDDASETYDLLDQFYERLSNAEHDLAVFRVVLHHFELGLLRLAGAAPTLRHCNRCGETWEAIEPLRLGRDGHGLVCGDCIRTGERWGVVERRTMEALHYLERPEGPAPQSLALGEAAAQIRRVIDASLALIVDRELRSRPMLDEVFAS